MRVTSPKPMRRIRASSSMPALKEATNSAVWTCHRPQASCSIVQGEVKGQGIVVMARVGVPAPECYLQAETMVLAPAADGPVLMAC